MTCKQKLKQFVLKFDIFCNTQFLRYEQEPEYRTLTGAICSIILVATICGVFMNVMLSTVQKTDIVWALNTVDEATDPFILSTEIEGKQKFMFAVAISGFNLSAYDRYFDVFFTFSTFVNGKGQPKVPITLQACTLDHWNVNEDIANTYKRMNFSKFLCPPIGTEIPIQGKYTSQLFKFAQVRIKKCNDSTDPTRRCRNSSEIQDYLSNYSYFYLNVYFLNTLVNPNSQEYITYYLQDRNYVQFTNSIGGLVNVFVSRYQITTDNSVWPFKNQTFDQGGIVNNLGQFIGFQCKGNDLARIVFRRASTSIVVERSYKKVDETLSYIGGLFGFIVTAMLFIKLYNQFSYQIDVGSHLYHYDKDVPISSDDFNFIFFIGYLFYLALDTIGLTPNWIKMKTFDQCREQIQKQFDVKFLFQRITFLQKSLTFLFNQNQFKMLHLHRKQTLKQAQQQREQYFSKKKIELDRQKANLQITEQNLDRTNSKIQNSKINSIYPENDLCNQKTINCHTRQTKIEGQVNNMASKYKSGLRLLRQNSLNGDEISQKIMNNLDSHIIKIIQQKQEEHQFNYNINQSEKPTKVKGQTVILEQPNLINKSYDEHFVYLN